MLILTNECSAEFLLPRAIWAGEADACNAGYTCVSFYYIKL